MSIPIHRLPRLRQSANVPPKCDHNPTHPVYVGGDIVHWRCACGHRKATDQYTEQLARVRRAVRSG